MLQKFIRDETAVTAVEYGLIAALISLMIVGGIGELLRQIQANFEYAAGEIENAGD